MRRVPVYVVGSIELSDIEKGLLTDAKITIQIVTKLSLDAPDDALSETVIAATPEKEGKKFTIPVQATLSIETIVLGNISSLTKERDGSFSFVGIHHTWYIWEKNYNAGMGRSDTYVTYKITVKREYPTTYEVIDTRHRG